MIGKDMTLLIGRTPMVRLERYEKTRGIGAEIYAKLEYMNPAGSAKDRAALGMIMDAEEKGLVGDGCVIIEPTSGNTGIALAAICAERGYRCIIVMPDTMSVERRKLMKAYGAEVVLTPGEKGMGGAIETAETLAKEHDRSFIPDQFSNPANPLSHYMTTGREIYEDMDGDISSLVCTIGTGGTISGTGRYLKEKDPGIKVYGAEPAGSPFLTEGRSGSHLIQGLGAGFIPGALDTGIYDRVVTVTDAEAYEATRLVARTEGILVGISSGAALAATEKLCNEGVISRRTAVILPDTGERYLSTPGLFEE